MIAVAGVIAGLGPFVYSQLNAGMDAVAGAPDTPATAESSPAESVAGGELAPAPAVPAPAAPTAGKIGWGGIELSEDPMQPLSPATGAPVPAAAPPLEPAVPSQFRVQRLTVSGRVPEPAVRAELERQRARLESCHLPASAARAKGTSSKLVARWVIGRSGDVSHVSLVESELLPSGDACVTRAIQGLTLPAPAGGIATVSADFAFTQR